MTRSFTNRLLVLGHRVLVADVRGIHEFDTSGRFRRLARRYQTALGGTYDVHLNALGDQPVASASGKGDLGSRDGNVRSALEISFLPEDTGSPEQSLLHLRNDFVTMPHPPPFPAQRPYLGFYRRTWDSAGGLLVAVSFEHYGVCFFDGKGGLLAAHGVDLRPQPTDRTERERELRRVYGNPDAVLPVLGVSARQLYEPHWPTHAPRYHDVVLRPDSLAWVQRATATGAVADIYHARAGYVGTVTLTDRRLPFIWVGARGWFAGEDSSGRLVLTSMEILDHAFMTEVLR